MTHGRTPTEIVGIGFETIRGEDIQTTSRLDSGMLIRRYIREARIEGDTYMRLNDQQALTTFLEARKWTHCNPLACHRGKRQSRGTSSGPGVGREDEKIVVRDTTQAGTAR